VHVIAHRGASKVERENTVNAFRTAVGMGADAIELDVRRTVDGVLVVHHDAHLADADGGAAICATLAADLPAHVPTLGVALDACAGVWVNVEIKNDPDEVDFDPTDSIADETIAHLLARATDERWLISCFRIDTVDRCRALAPQIRTAWLTGEVAPDTVATLVERGHTALHPWVALLDRATVDACHGAGVEVNTWTCDDPVRIAELIAWRVDGVCTNVPDVALRVRAAAGEPG
jgi:glycerophosphoryl diester phosphodiesterase